MMKNTGLKINNTSNLEFQFRRLKPPVLYLIALNNSSRLAVLSSLVAFPSSVSVIYPV